MGVRDLGAFELRTPIASGGMGTVWLARHHSTHSLVAVKVLSASASDQMYVEGFKREVRAVAALRHPRIVTVFDYGLVPGNFEDESLTPGSPWLAMELATRGSLVHASGINDFGTVCALLFDLLDALAHSHARGIIHRDIKPGNVLLVEENDGIRAKLSDFGIAHAKKESMQTREVFASSAGTPWYMAPEQIESRWRDYGPWTDLYALGCLAYELICGQTPFLGEPVHVAHQQLIQPSPAIRPQFEVPAGFADWIKLLMSKEVSQRFQRVADAAWSLEQLSRGWANRIASIETIALDVSWDDTVSASAPALGTTEWRFQSSLDTLIFDAGQTQTAEDVEVGAETRDFEPGHHSTWTFRPPPISESWRSGHEDRHERFSGAGLGLFGLRETPFVAREAERDAIWIALRDAARYRSPRAVILRGPIGAGKTRLAEWMCQRAHETGAATVFWSSHSAIPGPNDGLEATFEDYLGCYGLDAARTWARLSSFFRARMAVEENAQMLAARVCTLLHPDVDLKSLGAPDISLTGIQDRFSVMADVIALEAESRAVILAADDAHFGSETVEFIRYLQKRSNLPILNILTIPETVFEDAEVELASVDELLEQSSAIPMDIHPIDDLAHTRLLDGTLGLEHELRDQLIRASGGNPLYSLQMLEEWVARNKLGSTPRGYVIHGAIELPASLDQLWLQRLQTALANPDAEFDEALPALEVAAQMGNEVYFRDWQNVCQRLRIRPFAGLLDQLSERGLIHWTSHGFRFAHRPMRAALIQSARDSRRARDQHRATALELSRHPQTLRTSRRRVRHLLEAGEMGLALTPLVEVIKVQMQRGRYAAARSAIRKARMAASEARVSEKDPRYLELLNLRMQIAFRDRDTEQSARHATKILKLTNDDDHIQLRSRAWQHLCRASSTAGELAQASQFARRAIDSGRKSGDPMTIAAALRTAGWLAIRLGKFDLAEQQLHEAFEIFEAVGNPHGGASALAGLAEAARQSGDLVRARTLIEEAVERRSRFADPAGVSDALIQLGMILRDAGELAAAMETFERSLSLLDQEDPRVILNVLNLVHVLLIDRDAAQARRRLDEIQGHGGFRLNRTHRFFSTGYRAAITALQASPGEWDAAMKDLEEWPGHLFEVDIADVFRIAADAWRSRNDPGRAAQACDFALKVLPPGREDARQRLRTQILEVGESA